MAHIAFNIGKFALNVAFKVGKFVFKSLIGNPIGTIKKEGIFGWRITDLEGDTWIKRPFNVLYCPFCGKELPDEEYPFMLSTGRHLFHYHTGTMIRKGDALNSVAPEAYIELNSEDANQLGVIDGQKVKVSSRRGSIHIKVKISERVGKGMVFIPFHYKEAAANVLTNAALDPISKIPEFKVCAVKIEKLKVKN